jgi:hypothetical protein
MPEVLVLPDSFAGRADGLPPAFVCSWTDCGLDAIARASIQARQVTRRLVVLRAPPNVDRIFTLSGSIDVEIHDRDPVESPVQVLLRLAGEELAS